MANIHLNIKDDQYFSEEKIGLMVRMLLSLCLRQGLVDDVKQILQDLQIEFSMEKKCDKEID